MKKLAILSLLILLLLPTISFAQNSQNDQSPVDKNKVIMNLLQRIDAAGQALAESEAHEKDLLAEIAKADEAHKELTEAHKAALVELGETRATIKFQKSEIVDLKSQVELWRNESTRKDKELKSARKREAIAWIALILRSLL